MHAKMCKVHCYMFNSDAALQFNGDKPSAVNMQSPIQSNQNKVYVIMNWDIFLLHPYHTAVGCILIIAFLYQVYFYFMIARPLRSKPKARLATDNVPEAPSAGVDAPGVSVIICARNEGENLSHYLLSLLNQDYPLYEVIVVDDGSGDDTSIVVERQMAHDSRLHLTFVPKEARVRSTKKLGITLAAKAAQYDYLLRTDADCRPASSQWISRMMSGFDKEGVEIVLGYGAYFERRGVLNQMIQYDTLFNSLHYLGCALAHRPYMGVGRNLAYKKELFFRSGTFSDQMHLRSGDDDLLVNKIATRNNTAVVLDYEATTWSVPKSTWREWWLQKRRHLSVSPHYKARAKWHLAIEPLTRFLFYSATIALITLFILMPIGPIWQWSLIGLSPFAFRLLLQWAVLHRAERRLKHKPIWIGVIIWDILLPVFTAVLMMSRKTYKQYRW